MFPTASVMRTDPVSTRIRWVAPNPCRKEAKIVLDLARPCQVRLEIFDLLGRQVRGIARELGVGTQAIAWDLRDDHGSPVRAGMYIWRITMQNAPVAPKNSVGLVPVAVAASRA